jgi:hypothetical protein
MLTQRRTALFAQANFTQSITSGLLTFIVNGQKTTLLPLQDIDWQRILLDIDIPTATGGTSLTIKLKTQVSAGGSAITTTTMDAKSPASVNIASSAITSTGRQLIVAQRENDTGASNISGLIGVWVDVSGTYTTLSGKINLFVGR